MKAKVWPGTGGAFAGVVDTARELLEAWDAHDGARAAALCAPDFEGTDVAQTAVHRGPEGMAGHIEHYLEAFPDLTVSIDDVVASGERVALLWTLRGSHRGRLMGIPPTGKAVTVQGVALLRLQCGAVQHLFFMWDVARLLREIGLLPEL